MKNEFDELIQEIITFGELIAFAEDPMDSDYQNACQLFNDHLIYQFTDIRKTPLLSINKNEVKWSDSEISQLTDLITVPDITTTSHQQWISNLTQYCEQLQHRKLAMAS